MSNVVGSGCSILIPKERIALTVCMQSSLGRNPRSVHTPLERAATITARCEMLLSPGTVISRSIRDARFTRNSIERTCVPSVDAGVLEQKLAPPTPSVTASAKFQDAPAFTVQG